MSAAAQPILFDWHFAWQVLPFILRGLATTLEAVGVGMALALVLGLCWAVARRAGPRPLALAATAVVELVRSTPLLIQLYFLYFLLPEAGLALSPLCTGIVGLGLHYSTYTAEVYRAGIDAVPRGQWEAATALNLSARTTWLHVILPQAVPRVVPALGNYLVAIFKDTPLLSAITVAELLEQAKLVGAERFRYLEPLTLVGLLFLLFSLLAARGIHLVEKRYVVREG